MTKNKSLNKIGTVAKKSGTSIDTVRYYEQLGLLPKSDRSEGGFRLYSVKAINKLLFIKRAKSFGLTLKEIKKIMRCGEKGLEPCCDLVAKLFTNKIHEFETKIKELQGMKRRLKLLLSQWAKK